LTVRIVALMTRVGRNDPKQKTSAQGLSRVSISQVVHEPTRFGFLVTLAHAGGEASSRNICQKLGITRAAVLRHRRRLAKAGLITVDGRYVVMTDAGRAALINVMDLIREAVG
jgi:predicted transcriptional regulator